MSRMTMDFDPQAWNLLAGRGGRRPSTGGSGGRVTNLLAGLALVTGCSGRTISFDADSTDSTNTTDDSATTLNPDTGPDTDTDTGPECVDWFDCLPGYGCYDGVCEYVPHHDGHVPYYECYSDQECGQLSICEFNDCQYVYSPPPCEFAVAEIPVLEIPDPGLALAFVDVDQDGAQELIVATQTQLHVFESGSTMPVSHARGIESASVEALVGGDFDGGPGLDVLLLHDDELDVHASDGLGNLAPAVPSPSPYPLLGLVSGEFDGEPLTDLLLWGAEQSAIYYGDGSLTPVLVEGVTSGSARDLGVLGEGFTLLRDNDLRFIDIGGLAMGSAYLRGDSPRTQTRVDAFGVALELGSSSFAGWTLLDEFNRFNPNQGDRWGVLGVVTQSSAGDLDGLDDTDEIALILDGGVTVRIGGQCLLPVPLDSSATELAFGDHDGDGDDELAVLTAGGLISIVDVE